MPFYGPFPLSDAPSETPQFLDRSQIELFRQLFSRIFPGSSNFATFAGPGGGTVGLGFSHGSQLFAGQPPSSLNAIQNSAPPLAQGISGVQPETITGALAGLGLPSSQLTSLEPQNQPGATTFLGQPSTGEQPPPVSLLSPTGLPIKPVAEIGSDLATTVFGGGGGGTSGIGSPLSNDIGSGPISSLGFNTQGGGVQGALFGLSSSDVAAQLGFQAPTAIGGTAATIPAELAGFGGEFGGAVGAPATVPVSGTTGLLGSGGAINGLAGAGGGILGAGIGSLFGGLTGDPKAGQALASILGPTGTLLGPAVAAGLSGGTAAAGAASAALAAAQPALTALSVFAAPIAVGLPFDTIFEHGNYAKDQAQAGDVATTGIPQLFQALQIAQTPEEYQNALATFNDVGRGLIGFNGEGGNANRFWQWGPMDAQMDALTQQVKPWMDARLQLLQAAASGDPDAQAAVNASTQQAFAGLGPLIPDAAVGFENAFRDPRTTTAYNILSWLRPRGHTELDAILQRRGLDPRLLTPESQGFGVLPSNSEQGERFVRTNAPGTAEAFAQALQAGQASQGADFTAPTLANFAEEYNNYLRNLALGIGGGGE